MKKVFNSTTRIVVIVLVAFLTLFTCSCTNNDSINVKNIDKIYEVDNAVLASEFEKFNHKNLINDTPIHSVDSNATPEKTVKFNSIEYKLKYCDTIHYPVSGNKVCQYLVDGANDHCVLLNADGSIQAILFNFAKLNISANATASEICPILVSELKSIVDLSKYEYLETSVNNDKSEDNFRIYNFLYYNMQDNYMTDYVKVAVSGEGNVFGFSIHDLDTDVSALKTDKALEDEVLSAKLKDIYDTSNTTYQSYNTVFRPTIVLYNDELCVQHFVSATYINNENGSEMNTFIQRILIPVSIISVTK